MHGNQPKIKKDKCITLDFRKLSRMVKTVLVIYLHEMTEHDFLVLILIYTWARNILTDVEKDCSGSCEVWDSWPLRLRNLNWCSDWCQAHRENDNGWWC